MTATAPKKTKKAAPAAPAKSGSKAFMLGVVGIVVVGLLLVAFLAKGHKSAISGDPTGAVAISGAPLTQMPQSTGVTDSTTDPSYGAVAPTLVGTSFDGSDVTIKPDGRYKAVYFIAHWCPHCQKEVPLVQELISEGKVPANMDIYAVSTAVKPDAGNYPPQGWLDRIKLKATIMRDDANSQALSAYGGGGFPYAVYLDGDNKVIGRSSGELGKDGIATMWSQVSATNIAS
jgi:cytochrome c biogenesis protein CcmG, thiol:disulfide interchange protein DsbE